MIKQIFGVEIEDTPETKRFIVNTRVRATVGNPAPWAATWKVGEIRAPPGKRCLVIGIESFFPDAWKLAGIVLFVPVVFTGLVWSWWLAPGLAVLALSLFATASFRFLVLWLALRKHGYDGKVRRLSKRALLSLVVRW